MESGSQEEKLWFGLYSEAMTFQDEDIPPASK